MLALENARCSGAAERMRCREKRSWRFPLLHCQTNCAVCEVQEEQCVPEVIIGDVHGVSRSRPLRCHICRLAQCVECVNLISGPGTIHSAHGSYSIVSATDVGHRRLLTAAQVVFTDPPGAGGAGLTWPAGELMAAG